MQKKLELKSVPLVVAGVVLALMGQAQSADSPPPQAAQNPAVQSPAAPGHGPGFVDANGNGVCDRFEQGLPPAGGRGAAWAGRGRFQGRGPGFVDANGNGVCDRFEQELPPAGGRGRGWRR